MHYAQRKRTRRTFLVPRVQPPMSLQPQEYESYQENGTKYIKSRKVLPDALIQPMRNCVGEIFITGIPVSVTAAHIANIAAMLGEVYMVRFKVNFAGNSRGYAYLQYMDPTMMAAVIPQLKGSFCMYYLPMIRVCQSRNCSKLLMTKVYHTPNFVYEWLCQNVSFEKLVAWEVRAQYFQYQIIFACNDEAIIGRRTLMRSIHIFGRDAKVMWDYNNNRHNRRSKSRKAFESPAIQEKQGNRQGLNKPTELSLAALLSGV